MAREPAKMHLKISSNYQAFGFNYDKKHKTPESRSFAWQLRKYAHSARNWKKNIQAVLFLSYFCHGKSDRNKWATSRGQFHS